MFIWNNFHANSTLEYVWKLFVLRVPLFSMGECAIVHTVNCSVYFFQRRFQIHITLNKKVACHLFIMFSTWKMHQGLGHRLALLNGANLRPKTQQHLCQYKVIYMAEIRGYALHYCHVFLGFSLGRKKDTIWAHPWNEGHLAHSSFCPHSAAPDQELSIEVQLSPIQFKRRLDLTGPL